MKYIIFSVGLFQRLSVVLVMCNVWVCYLRNLTADVRYYWLLSMIL